MAVKKKAPRRFAVCVKNAGYEAALERNKIYVVLPDADASKDGDVRVVDESGEDYLYPAAWFIAVELPKAVEVALLKAS
jgi:archaellum component FlaG (FlaF/FlaG flagellin family)